MKIIKIAIALLVIVGAAFWAYDSVRPRSFEGSQLEFAVGNGNIVNLTYDSEAPLSLVMTSSRAFAVNSSEEGLSGTSTREGSGRNVTHNYLVDLPADTAEFHVTRGSDITLTLEGASSAEAVVTPMNAEATRNTIIVAIVVILAALYYVSSILQHRWLKTMVQKLRPNEETPAQQPSASEVGG